jgi:hypothetical protein
MLRQRHRGTERSNFIGCCSAPARLRVSFYVALILVANSVGFSGEVDPVKIALLVDEMASRGSGYDATELRALGADGLTGVLDCLLPDTAPPREVVQGPPEEEIRRLILRLDADDFRVREAATEELVAKGRGRRELIEEATKSELLEVRLRAERVLASWESRPTTRLNDYLSGFWAYAEGLKGADELKILAERTIKALESGMPEGDRLHLLRLCIAAVAHGHDDASCDLLRPLVRNPDPRIAALVAETAGAYKVDPKFVPQLLVDAILDERPAVTEAGLRFVLGGQDGRRREAVLAALRRVFQGKNEPLKFQACLPLMRDFQDAEAWLYVIGQTASNDTNRVRTAFNWIGDTKNCGRAPNIRLQAILVELISSGTIDQRRAAVQALGTFTGESVVTKLIGLIGDREAAVSQQAKACLLAQPDRKLVARLLETIGANSGDQVVQSRSKELMASLQRGE